MRYSTLYVTNRKRFATCPVCHRPCWPPPSLRSHLRERHPRTYARLVASGAYRADPDPE